MISSQPGQRISLTDLARRERVNTSTAWRWCRRGVKGHKLESICVGGQRFTTQAAYEHWLAKINGDGGSVVVHTQAHAVDAAERELDELLGGKRNTRPNTEEN